MREITEKEYLDFVEKNKFVEIGKEKISLEPIKVERFEPKDEEMTATDTTVWSFPKRGTWATHRGDYRGNWPPQIPRVLIEKYSKEGETVLDPMAGSGTTCIEAVLLGRNCIAVDLNLQSAILTYHRLYWLLKAFEEQKAKPSLFGNEQRKLGSFKVFHGDARNLEKLQDESIDLILTHPPYLNIVGYNKEKTEGDLSGTKKLEEYLKMLRDVLKECYRVLKKGKVFGILVGDTRSERHYIPITTYALLLALDVGFVLKEEVIKVQHKMKTTREVWNKKKEKDFLLIEHEKLFILEKLPETKSFKYSKKQPFFEFKL